MAGKAAQAQAAVLQALRARSLAYYLQEYIGPQ